MQRSCCPRVRPADQQARHRRDDGVGARRTVVREHRRLRAHSRDERVARRIATHEVVEVRDGSAQEARVAREAIRLHEHEPLVRGDRAASPHEVGAPAHRDAVGRRVGDAAQRAREAVRADRRSPSRAPWRKALGDARRATRAPACRPRPTRHVDGVGAEWRRGDEEAVLLRRERELGRRPAELVAHAPVAVRAGLDLRRGRGVEPVLLVQRVGVLTRPPPGGERCARERVGESRAARAGSGARRATPAPSPPRSRASRRCSSARRSAAPWRRAAR